MTNRDRLFLQSENEPNTFAKDDLLPNLPLPSLNETLERYYDSLKPFGNAEQLAKSRKVIENFKNGIGKKLHSILVERTKNHRNWVEKWWEDYAYCTDRTPIIPLCAMAAVLLTESVNVEASPQYRLKGTARLIYSILEHYELIRTERLKPSSNPDGSITFSMFLYRRLYNSLREPGEIMDSIKTYFKTASEGVAPNNIIIMGKGRIFSVDFYLSDGSIMAPAQILAILVEISDKIDASDMHVPIPVLTCDDRSSWAINRKYLKELSPKNAESLKMIEESIMVMTFDEHHPDNWSDAAQHTISGDLHSKWADKSSAMVMFRNGRFGYIGEHSCYDGTVSVMSMMFHILTLLEYPEPDWDSPPSNAKNCITEIRFDVDQRIENEVERVLSFVQETGNSIIVSTTCFSEYGRNFMKIHKLRPDAYIQMILQVVYYKMHSEIVATYESALMRSYYNGRTETVRSVQCETVDWVMSFMNDSENDDTKLRKLRLAVDRQHKLMNDARDGKGIDRHMFGLWCAAYEQNIDIPELYDDPLYKKSGGGGNFVLSSSTLGYSINNGFVGPMVKDGYGIFYTMTSETIWLHVTATRESTTTSAHKFARTFNDTMVDVKNMIDRALSSKL
ncbi:Peroxisomal carnitine O-octanoyltransferase [Pseudolycoriella hygida]|uniref:Peroxisomal carnitine O-octanoyltransferase n=1 Tax=Pseudolycoriella hygida TaxID=35572 RepID=A0A9Q0MSW3_9DIPT|nr:Peroxisomal carnitine O-octanoyltransferase [Pseudolycoriella hygida]